MTDLYIIGQDINAGSPVIRCEHDGKIYTPPCRAGVYVGDAVEQLREGFRAASDGKEVREDDA